MSDGGLDRHDYTLLFIRNNWKIFNEERCPASEVACSPLLAASSKRLQATPTNRLLFKPLAGPYPLSVAGLDRRGRPKADVGSQSVAAAFASARFAAVIYAISRFHRKGIS